MAQSPRGSRKFNVMRNHDYGNSFAKQLPEYFSQFLLKVAVQSLRRLVQQSTSGSVSMTLANATLLLSSGKIIWMRFSSG